MLGKRLCLLIGGLLLSGAGCLTKSYCQENFDCATNEICIKETGECRIGCTRREDCWYNGMDIGKECFNNKCDFPVDRRVAAPNFCLKDINPQSASFGKELCLQEATDKVVLLYFAWLT
jgi:hypothetical protein